MNILLVDDEQMVLSAVSDFIEEQLGHNSERCINGREAAERIESGNFHLVIADIRMPGMDGITLLKRIKDNPDTSGIDVVLMTAYADVKTAVQALRNGAFDYIRKPFDIEELAAVVERVAEHQSLISENRELSQHFEERVAEASDEQKKRYERLRDAYSEIAGIGRIGIFSESMRRIHELARRFHEDRTVPVIIEGETGTGKEIIARLIHFGEEGVSEPFVTINCSAISPSLFESELFGYEGGSFTGSRKEGGKGKLELADSGTLLLDEIGDMPVEMQPKLLRVLQEREFYKVGGVKKVQVDVRIICATNMKLEEMLAKGKFRQDLYYRLNTGRIQIPPLRERRGAITPLAQLFLERFASQKKRRFRLISKEAAGVLEQYSWPGNVRELENAIERVVLLYDGIEVLPEHLSFLTSGEVTMPDAGGEPFSPENIVLPEENLDLQHIENTIIRKALEKFDGNKTHAARYLGMTRSTLRSRLRKIT